MDVGTEFDSDIKKSLAIFSTDQTVRLASASWGELLQYLT